MVDRSGESAEDTTDEFEEDSNEPERPPDTRRRAWRIGSKYGIHVYEGSTPVCTALTEDYARQIISDHNASPDPGRVRTEWGRPVAASEIADALEALRCRLSPGYWQQIKDLVDRVDEGGIDYRL